MSFVTHQPPRRNPRKRVPGTDKILKDRLCMFIPFDPEQMLTRFLFAAANVTARP